MFYIEDRYSVTELEGAYNSLPSDIKEALVIRQQGLEIGGWKQFLGFYPDKLLACDKTPEQLNIWKDRFLTIVFDNLLTIEQIKRGKQIIEELGNIEKNWKTVNKIRQAGANNTLSTNLSSTESTNKTASVALSTSSTSDKSRTVVEGTTQNRNQNTTGRKNSNITAASDNNSFGNIEGGQEISSYISFDEPNMKMKYPVNTINSAGGQEQSTALTTDSQQSNNTTALDATHSNTQGSNQSDTNNNNQTSAGQSKSDSVNTSQSFSESSNASEDLREYYSLYLPALRARFFRQFQVLFLY